MIELQKQTLNCQDHNLFSQAPNYYYLKIERFYYSIICRMLFRIPHSCLYTMALYRDIIPFMLSTVQAIVHTSVSVSCASEIHSNVTLNLMLYICYHIGRCMKGWESDISADLDVSEFCICTYFFSCLIYYCAPLIVSVVLSSLQYPKRRGFKVLVSLSPLKIQLTQRVSKYIEA